MAKRGIPIISNPRSSSGFAFILLLVGLVWLAIDLGYIDISKLNISPWPVLIILLALFLLMIKKR